MAIRGKTPGRNIVGLEIVDAAGEEMSFGRGILREIVGKFISGIFFYLGYIWVAFDERKQGWHDKIAGTYVVRK